MAEDIADMIRPNIAKRYTRGERKGEFYGEGIRSIYAVPTGGYHLATIISSMLNLPIRTHVESDQLVVDDVIDTGRTIYSKRSHPLAVFNARSHETDEGKQKKRPYNVEPDFHILEVDDELVFPWQMSKKEYAIHSLERLEDNPNRLAKKVLEYEIFMDRFRYAFADLLLDEAVYDETWAD